MAEELRENEKEKRGVVHRRKEKYDNVLDYYSFIIIADYLLFIIMNNTVQSLRYIIPIYHRERGTKSRRGEKETVSIIITTEMIMFSRKSNKIIKE